MPPKSRYVQVVEANHRKTKAYLVAGGLDCAKVRDDEVQAIERNITPLTWENLQALKPTGSWALGVILCPGDNLAGLAAWLRRHKGARPRITFFALPSVDLAAAFADWPKSTRRPHVFRVESWKDLHPIFGRALNDQVFEDFG